jgi:hypothetical protein
LKKITKIFAARIEEEMRRRLQSLGHSKCYFRVLPVSATSSSPHFAPLATCLDIDIGKHPSEVNLLIDEIFDAVEDEIFQHIR